MIIMSYKLKALNKARGVTGFLLMMLSLVFFEVMFFALIEFGILPDMNIFQASEGLD